MFRYVIEHTNCAFQHAGREQGMRVESGGFHLNISARDSVRSRRGIAKDDERGGTDQMF